MVGRTHAENGRQLDYGVEPGASDEDMKAIFFNNVKDDPTTPWCCCASRAGGFGFDGQLGVYVHADPKCWRPSKPYYEGALRAGILSPPIERGSDGTREESAGETAGRRRQPVQLPPSDGGDRPTARRRPQRRPSTSSQVGQGSPAGAARSDGADEPAGGDVGSERSGGVRPARPRRRPRRDTSALWGGEVSGSTKPCRVCGTNCFGGTCAKCRGE